MSEAPVVSIVIPTWNRRDLAEACLRSVDAQTYRDYECIVADDGSSDGTAAWLREHRPGVRVIALPRNGGFARAANAGMRAARGSWVLLLNNDMTPEAGFLAELLRAAEETGADMIAPLVLWRDDPAMIYSAGDVLTRGFRPESAGFRRPRAGYSAPQAVFGVSGGAGLFRRAMLDDTGLLDECFTAYFEDADLCFRARLAGYRAAVALEAVALHEGSASIQGRTWWRSAQCCRNHLLLVVKNVPFPLLVTNAPWILAERANQWRRCFSSARAAFGAPGALRVCAATGWALLCALPHALRARRRIQGRRQIKDSELRALIGADGGE